MNKPDPITILLAEIYHHLCTHGGTTQFTTDGFKRALKKAGLEESYLYDAMRWYNAQDRI